MHPFQSRKKEKKKCSKCGKFISSDSTCKACFESEVLGGRDPYKNFKMGNWVPIEEDNQAKGHNIYSFWSWVRGLMSTNGIDVSRLDAKGMGQLKHLVKFCGDKRCMKELEEVCRFVADNITQLKDTFGWTTISPGVLLGFWFAIKLKQKKSGSFRSWKKEDWSKLTIDPQGDYNATLSSNVPSTLPPQLSVSSLWKFVMEELSKRMVPVTELGIAGRKVFRELCEKEGLENVAPVIKALTDNYFRFQERFNWSPPFKAQALVGFWDGIKREVYSNNQGLKEKVNDSGNSDYSGYTRGS